MNNSTTIQADASSSGSDIKQPKKFDWLQLLAEELMASTTTCFGYAVVVGVLLVSLAPLVAVVSSGEVLLGSMVASNWAAFVALPAVLLLVGCTTRRELSLGWYRGLVVRWLIWTAITFGLVYAGLLSLQSYLLLAGVNALVIALGGSVERLTAAPRPKKIKTRTDLQWFGIISLKIGLSLVIGSASTVAFAFGTIRLNHYADHLGYVGKKAPAVSGKTVDGEAWSLDDYQGKVVLLDFLDASSRFELSTLPTLLKVKEVFSGNPDLVVVSVLDSKYRERAEWFVQQKVGWPLLQVNDSNDEGFQPGSWLPLQKVYLIDRDGTVRFVTHGGLLGDFGAEGDSAGQLEREVTRLLEERKRPTDLVASTD